MELIIKENLEEVSSEAAKIFINQIKNNPKSTLGLATGSSPIKLYKILIKEYEDHEISFKNIKTFNLDEYCGLDREHEQSYYHYMNQNLFSHIDIQQQNINIPSGAASDLEEECKRYNTLLKKSVIDLQLLGIGANGHIGFNEPGTSFDQETFVVKLDRKTREDNARFFGNIENVPTHATTMGISNIVDAKKIVLIANGENKAEAISKLINGDVDEDLPASILKKHNNVTVIVDKAAASKL